MALSTSEHHSIQQMIDSASTAARQQLHTDAENTLAQINVLMSQKMFSSQQRSQAESAIEILVRIEATEKGKGWWFRAKRRIQLTQMYLGS
jgi:hypothetical protein